MNNYTEFSNAPNFDIREPPMKLQNAGSFRGSIGGPLTDRLRDNNGINKGYASETNVSVKATIVTRTRDQKYVNQHQLAFIYSTESNFDKPVLLSIQQINVLLAGGNPSKEEEEKQIFGKRESDHPCKWSRKEIVERFKPFGTIVNRDVDTRNDMQTERMPRATTLCIKGDCHVLDYWSESKRRLKPYDTCYFVLKYVWVSPDARYMANIQTRFHGVGHAPRQLPPNGGYCWQIFPFNCSDRYIHQKEYTTKIPVAHDNTSRGVVCGDQKIEGLKVLPPTQTTFDFHIDVMGYYWKVGNVHEYASIGNPDRFEQRKAESVPRDITYLIEGGSIRPLQFYLELDDASKLLM